MGDLLSVMWGPSKIVPDQPDSYNLHHQFASAQLTTFFAAILQRREQMDEPVVARATPTDSASP